MQTQSLQPLQPLQRRSVADAYAYGGRRQELPQPLGVAAAAALYVQHLLQRMHPLLRS